MVDFCILSVRAQRRTRQSLFGPDMLQFLVRPQEIVSICLWKSFPLIWLLHKILVTLLLCKANRIFPRLEVNVCALHKIGR